MAFLGLGSKKTEDEEPEEPELTEEEKEKKKYKDMVKQLYFKAYEAMGRKKFVAADKIFHEALDLATDLANEGKLTKEEHLNMAVFLYVQMANNNLTLNNSRAAEKLFKNGIAVALELGMAANHNAIVEMSLKLANIYASHNDEDLAVSGYRFCIQEQELKMSKDGDLDEDTKALLGLSYRAYGRYLGNKQKYNQALKASNKALDISKELFDEGDDQVLSLMSDIGNVLVMMERYDEAEAMFKEGIRKGRKSKAEILSALYCNLGALYLRTSRLFEAESACRKAKSLGEEQQDKLFQNMADQCLHKIRSIKTKEKLAKSE